MNLWVLCCVRTSVRAQQKNNQSEIDLTDPMGLMDLKNLMVIKSWVTDCA